MARWPGWTECETPRESRSEKRFAAMDDGLVGLPQKPLHVQVLFTVFMLHSEAR